MSAAATELRPLGVAGGVRRNRPARRSEQMVWVPEEIYRGAHYSDETVVLYPKLAALDARRHLDGTPCTASVQGIADFCGMSKSGAERGLRQMAAPGPGGTPAQLATARQTHRGGRGKNAERRLRPVLLSEAALQVRVAAAEALRPRLFRAYLHLKRAEALGLPVSAGELAGELFHHTGQKIGQPLSERTARRILDELDRLGWITLDHRAGYQGRHLITVHDTPLRPVPTTDTPAPPADTTADPGPANHDGSGPASGGGSLASKEDSCTFTDSCPQVGGGIRRRRGDRSGPVDNPGAHAPATRGPGSLALRAEATTTAPTKPTCSGPDLTISARVHAVLEPVRHLMADVTPYVARAIARAVGEQLDAGADVARLRHRLRHRVATTETIRDPGRWILGAGLPRRGCGLTECESGVIWSTGMRCEVCGELRADRRRAAGSSGPAPTPVVAAAGGEQRPDRPTPTPPSYRAVVAAQEALLLAPPAPATPPTDRPTPPVAVAEAGDVDPARVLAVLDELGEQEALARYGARAVARALNLRHRRRLPRARRAG